MPKDTQNPGQIEGGERLEYSQLLEDAMNSEMKSRVHIPERDIPNLIILAGACRTDTGALSTAFAQSPDVETAHIQPIKTVRRRVLSLKATNTDIEYARLDLDIEPGSRTHVVKETVGIKTQAELFDAVRKLLECGYPPEKVKVIGTFKSPIVVYDSDARVYGPGYASPEDINIHFFITWQMLADAHSLGIPIAAYVGETYLRDNDPHRSVKTLLDWAEVKYHNGVVEWGNGHGYEADVTHYEIPPHRFISGSVSKSSGGRGGLKWADHKFVLPKEELDIAQGKLTPAYEIYYKALAMVNEFL